MPKERYTNAFSTADVQRILTSIPANAGQRDLSSLTADFNDIARRYNQQVHTHSGPKAPSKHAPKFRALVTKANDLIRRLPDGGKLSDDLLDEIERLCEQAVARAAQIKLRTFPFDTTADKSKPDLTVLFDADNNHQHQVADELLKGVSHWAANLQRRQERLVRLGKQNKPKQHGKKKNAHKGDVPFQDLLQNLAGLYMELTSNLPGVSTSKNANEPEVSGPFFNFVRAYVNQLLKTGYMHNRRKDVAIRSAIKRQGLTGMKKLCLYWPGPHELLPKP